MDVTSRGPLRTAALVWQQKPGTFVLTVACKATFTLVPGTCTLAPEQPELNDEDQFVNDDSTRSLVGVREIVPCKRHVETVLVGSAYAPRNELVKSLVVRLVVGPWDKLVAVHGDRVITRAGIVRGTQSFTRMPLRYERAAWSPDNPAGMRVEPRGDDKPVPLPNLVPVGTRITNLTDKIAPTGFGPIAPTWPTRAHLLAKTSPPWTPDRWSTVPMPEGFDTDFFAIAPADQRLRSIAPDEPLVLDHLHPQHPRLVTRLPGILPRASIERPTLAPAPMDFVADTLWIDSDQLQCSVIYRGYVVLESRHQPGRVVIDMVQVPVRATTTPVEAVLAAQPLQSTPALSTVVRQESTVELADADLVDEPSTWAINQVDTDARPPAIAKSLAMQALSPAMETVRLSGPVVVAPAMPFVPPIVPQPAAMTPPTTPPNAPVQHAPPNPVVPDKPPVIPMEPARIVIKARSSSSSSEVEPPRVASSEEIAQLLKRAHATPGSAAAFSDAAASSASKGSSLAAPHDAPTADVRPMPTAVVELLWFDSQAVPHIRTESTWRSILDKLATPGKDRPDSGSKTKPRDTPEQRDLRALLATAPAFGMDDLRRAMTNAIDDLGGFVPPFVLLTGDLFFPFDELEALKATVGAVMPFVANDKKLKEAVDTISELLRSPWLSGATDVADGLTAQIKTAFGEKSRGLTPGYLEKHTERMLLERKQYQRRAVFKQSCIRGLLQLPGSSEPLPTYLPADVGRDLPTFQRFRVRIIAECYAQVDQHETSSIALKILALGRELSGFAWK